MGTSHSGTVVVTGAAGQDGSYLCESLMSEGNQVVGLVQQFPVPGSVVQGVDYRCIDLRDHRRLAHMIREIAPEAIYNLAGMSSVARSWQHPVEAVEVNGLAVVAMLEAAYAVHSKGVPVRFFQASSAEVFGLTHHVPQDESTQVRPASPYGVAKAMAHHAVQVYRHRGLFSVNGILYNHESPRRSEFFVTRKITSTVARIARGSGEKLRLGDMTVRRDFGWAPEYVTAMMAMLQAEVPEDFIIATGQAHSIAEFTAAAFAAVQINDWEAYVDLDPDLVRPVDPVELLGDPTRISEKLGWRAETGYLEVARQMVLADLEGLDP